MLKQVRVQNFKVIEDTDLLPIQPLMAIIGRNGSGKSSLVEALDWLGRALSEGVEAATEPFHRIRDVINGWDEDQTRVFTITLVFDPQDASIGTDVTYRVEIGTDEQGETPRVVTEELTARVRSPRDEFFIQTADGNRQVRVPAGAPVRDKITAKETANTALSKSRRSGQLRYVWRTFADPDRLALSAINPLDNPVGDSLREFLTCAVFLRLNPRTIAGFSPPRAKPSPRLLDEEGSRLAHLLSTFDEELLAILVEKLANILQRADRLETHRPNGPADRRFFTLLEQRGPDAPPLQVPAWTLSEGTRRITAILAPLLADNPPPLLCIEEVENGLDPWTIKYLLDELAAAVVRGTQVVLTSHSPYLLNMLPLSSIMFCYRPGHTVEFAAGDRLPDLDVIQQRMGPGDLYANRYFHRSLEERSNEDRDSV